MPPGMKEKNANPRTKADALPKAMKKRLSEIVNDPTMIRHSAAQLAAVDIHQMYEVAMARIHKQRAFTVFLDRLPPVTATAAQQAAEGFELRRYQCLPAISSSDQPSATCI